MRHFDQLVVERTVFAEELGDGARGMTEDRLAEIIPPVDVAMAQHVLPLPAGYVGTRSGPVLSAAESLRITVYGRGGHGSMPHTTGGNSIGAPSAARRSR